MYGVAWERLVWAPGSGADPLDLVADARARSTRVAGYLHRGSLAELLAQNGAVLPGGVHGLRTHSPSTASQLARFEPTATVYSSRLPDGFDRAPMHEVNLVVHVVERLPVHPEATAIPPAACLVDLVEDWSSRLRGEALEALRTLATSA